MSIYVFPTDTLFGLGCPIDNVESYKKIYKLKNRSENKPLPILCGSIEQVSNLVNIKEYQKYIDKFWPGMLTIVFNDIKENNNKLISSQDSLAIRIPNHRELRDLLIEKGPMFVTSANVSGRDNLYNIEDIEKVFGNEVTYYYNFKSVIDKRPSTIIKVENDQVVVAREGAIEKKFIFNV